MNSLTRFLKNKSNKFKQFSLISGQGRNRNYSKPSKNKTSNNNNVIHNNSTEERDTIPTQLYALAARLNIRVSNPKLLLQAVTHKTCDDSSLPSNEGFRVLG